MFFVTNNLAALAVVAVLGSFAWVWGGTRGDLLLSFVPWVSFLLFEAMLVFPQRSTYESMPAARLRVWRAFRADPLTWACVGFLGLLLIPFFNSQIRALPWCVSWVAHLNVVLWFLPTLMAMLAAKHSLRRHGKRLVVSMIVWNGVLLAGFGFLQACTQARGPFWVDLHPGVTNAHLEFFASFGYANMAGDYFTSLALLAVGLWRRQLEESEALDPRLYSAYRMFWKRHYHLIAVVILYFAALVTGSRASIMLSTLGVVFLFVLAGLSRLKRLHRAARVKFVAVLVFSVICIVLFSVMFFSTQRRIGKVTAPRENVTGVEKVRNEFNKMKVVDVLNRMVGKGDYHFHVASQLLGDYPVFGCGGWGYAYLSPEKLPPDFAKGYILPSGKWCAGTANVHNDYLQFMCEHGIVGFVLLVLIVVLAVIPAARRWRRLALAARFTKHSGLPWPKGFFCFPPAGVAIYASAIATMIHAFADCPLRSPAILSLFFVQLVLVEGFLPRDDNNEE